MCLLNSLPAASKVPSAEETSHASLGTTYSTQNCLQMLTDVSSVESTLQVGRTDSRKDLSTQAGVKDHPQDGVILQEN